MTGIKFWVWNYSKQVDSIVHNRYSSIAIQPLSPGGKSCNTEKLHLYTPQHLPLFTFSRNCEIREAYLLGRVLIHLPLTASTRAQCRAGSERSVPIPPQLDLYVAKGYLRWLVHIWIKHSIVDQQFPYLLLHRGSFACDTSLWLKELGGKFLPFLSVYGLSMHTHKALWYFFIALRESLHSYLTYIEYWLDKAK